MKKHDKDFRLDYDKTKGRILGAFPILRKYRDTYDCVVQDTFADYYEILQNGEWPYEWSHVAWFKYRVWYNLKDYEPFKTRRAEQQWKTHVPPSFVELMERDGCNEQPSPEELMVLEETKAELLADKWGIPVDTEDDVGMLLLQGCSCQDIEDILQIGSSTVYFKLDRLRGKHK